MFDVFKRLGFHFEKYKKNYIIAVVCLIMADFLALVMPRIIAVASDSIYSGLITKSTLAEYALILIVVTIVNYIVSYLWGYYTFNGGDRLAYDLRLSLFQKLLKQSAKFFETHTSGDLMTNATGDVDSLQETAGFGIFALVDATVLPFIILFVMIVTSSFKLTVISVLPLVLLVPLTIVVGRKVNNGYTIVQNTNSEINDAVLENVSGVRVVRAFGVEDLQCDDFYDLTYRSFKENVVLGYWQYAYSIFATIIPIASYVICLYFGAHMVSRGELSLGDIIGMQLYLSMLIWPMISMGEFINTSQMGNAGLDRINSMLNYEEDVVNAPNALKLSTIDEIKFDGLTFQYPSSIKENLTDISFTIPRGKTLGIVGKTGSGKSTVIKQLLREYVIGEKQVFINGNPIEAYDLSSLANAIAYVPQENMLFSKSIRDNILLKDKNVSEECLNEVIKITDLERDIKTFNEGLNTMAGEKGISLSGGQKQRIAIARALINESELLILDDCLSAVDANTEKNIIAHIRERRSGKTSIIVTHRLSAITHADEIIVLSDGKITERGTHEQLVAQGGWYATQYEYQKSGGGEDE